MLLTAGQQSALLDIARAAIRSTLLGRAPAPVPSAPALESPSGCFVSLHHAGTHRLRGCIGRLESSDSLAETVREMAAAVLEDPRFAGDPVTLDELDELEIELSVISPLTPAAHPLDFDPPEDGIYLTCADRTGCFLPQVARETGWTREQLLQRLCTEKMGLPANAWREVEARLHRFKVVVIGPERF